MKRFRVLLLVGAVTFGPADPAFGEREVIVNGQRLSAQQIAALERLRCGPIRDGDYWLAERSGLWGHAGNPRPQGRISDYCRQGTRAPLSERGWSIESGETYREEASVGTTSQPHTPTEEEARH